MGVSPRTGKIIKSTKNSAVRDHMLVWNNIVSFADFSVLANGTNDFRIKLQQSLLIHRDEPQLNKTSESARLTLFSWRNPKLLVYIDFFRFTTMYVLLLNQSKFLVTPLYVHKIQFISKLQTSSSSHGQHRELVFLFSHWESYFLKRHTRLFVEPHPQSDLSSSIFKSNDNCVGVIN